MKLKLNMKKIILSIVILCLSACSKKITELPENAKIVAFGDSLTSGVGADNISKSYIAHLAQSLGITIINKGVGGNTTAKALARIQTDVIDLEPQPEVAIILLGGNDFFKGIPQATTEENLKQIVDLIKKDGIKVILLGISRLHFPDYEKMIQSIAMQKNVNYVPAILDGIVDAEDLMNDLKHPNSDGYKLMSQRIEPTLIRVLLED